MRINGKNIITTDDISVTKDLSNLGESLSDIILNQSEELDKLNSNIKWLYKYGGVGGSGSGSSVSKLKASFSIEYTDLSGILQQEKLEANKIYNIKKGTSFTVIATITSIKSLPEYIFSIGDSKTVIKAIDVNGKLIINPEQNSKYTLVLSGETTISLDFNVYVDIYSFKSGLYEDGFLITNDTFFYNLENLQYKINLTNYQFSKFPDIVIKNFLFNESEVEYSIDEELIGDVKYYNINFDVSNEINEGNYGLYKFSVLYSVSGKDIKIDHQYIYKKKDEVYVYCYSKTGLTLYQNEDTPDFSIFSKERTETLYYKVFGTINHTISTRYEVVVEYGQNKTYSTNVTNGVENILFIDNKSEEKRIEAIKFIINSDSEFIYKFVQDKPDPLDYFFKGNNSNYYGVIYESTDDIPAKGVISGFPDKDPNSGAFVCNQDQTFKINIVAEKSGAITSNTIIDYIKSAGSSPSNVTVDGLISLGIRYFAYRHDQPIITVTDSNKNKIILYKNKIDYYKNNSSQVYNTLNKIVVPNNINNYNLVQLYIKSSYSISGTNPTQTLFFCVDGIIESVPFNIDEFYLGVGTTITFHAGRWDYNHIGIATFNCIPNGIDSNELLKNYIYNIDPVLLSNYYQVYIGKSDFDEGIYNNLNWIQYYNKQNKFISMPANLIASKLTNLPVYRIVPSQKEGSTGINDFLLNTLTSYSKEGNETLPRINCKFQKFENGSFQDIITGIQYYVTYQGSSTLLFGAKNFEIGTIDQLDQQTGNYTYTYFSPDINKFKKLEKCFNLKADVVDSSHSNNVVIGNFVNDYMKSPFDVGEDKYNSCLTGYPCILYMTDNKDGKGEQGNNDILLGIYNMNLGRSSTNNLGYTKINNLEEQNGNFEEVKYYQTQDSLVNNYENYVIAEVQGNSPLFDYSQFDKAFLTNMLGDFFVASGKKGYNEEFSNAFISLFKDLASYVKWKFLTETITGTGQTNPSVFDQFNPDINNNKVNTPSNSYYYNGTILTKLPENATVILFNDVSNIFENYKQYSEYNSTKITKITNPLQQFHILCDNQGKIINDTNNGIYLYVEELRGLSYDLEENHNTFNIENVIKYYVTCMAFGMVDSVQKNLTIKCPNFIEGNNNYWYLGFYDMDTAFGISNSGGEINFKAFSDYVADDTIISDYVNPNEINWFDSPSSYIFLYAKYAGILDDSINLNGNVHHCPLWYWYELRTGILKSANEFYTKYVDNYFKEINPLIWNLNYLYKYFGVTNNKDSVDTEISRFNGTMTFRRKEWLQQRIDFLDPLFGINSNRLIGRSGKYISGLDNPSFTDLNNEKVSLSMFPDFTKGAQGKTREVTVQGESGNIIVFKTSTSTARVYILDKSTGEATIKAETLGNTDIGLLGSRDLYDISDAGTFLIHPQKDNTLVNNKLRNLKINSGNSNVKVVINLKDLESVETISFNNANFKTIELINSDPNRIIKDLNIKNSKIGNLTISGLKITNFNLEGCNISNLVLNELAIDLNRFSNNSIMSYAFKSNTFNTNLNISDSQCKSIDINSGNYKNINLSTNYLNTLKIQGSTIDAFYYNDIYGLSSCTIAPQRCNTFILGNKINKIGLEDESNFNTELTTAEFVFKNEVTFKIAGFNNLQNISIESSNTINLPEFAFAYNYNLESIPIITYNIKGNAVFYKCANLNTSNNLSTIKIATTNISYLYCGNKVNNLNFVVKWFGTYKALQNLNMSHMFEDNINVYCYLDTNITNFITNFKNFWENYTGVMDNLFYNSNFRVLTKEFSKLIYDHSINKQLVNILGCCIYAVYSNSYEYYIESGSLHNFTLVSLDNANCKIFDENKNLISDVKMSNLFPEECKITRLENFSIYMDTREDSIISFDVENGFPQSITTLDNVFHLSSYFNMINAEKMFNHKINVSGKFLIMNPIFIDHHINYSRPNKYTNSVDLWSLLFNDEGNLKINSLDFLKSNTVAYKYNFTFPKKITYENFNKLFNYLISNNITQINWLFSNCNITEVSDANLLSYKLHPFTSLQGTFYNCNVENIEGNTLHLNINDIFKKIEINEETNEEQVIDSCKVEQLGCAFARNYLKQITETISTKGICKNMDNTFRSCYWEYNTEDIPVMQIMTGSGVDTSPNPVDNSIKILPDNFFKVLAQRSSAKDCFSSNFVDKLNLRGYLSEGWFNKSDYHNFSGLFRNAIIYYQKVIDKTTAETYYLIFPDWYAENLTDYKFNVTIPICPKGVNSYLFDYIKNCQYYYSPLPNLFPLLKDEAANSYYVDSKIKLQLDPNESDYTPGLFKSRYGSLPFDNSSNYKEIIPLGLFYLLNPEDGLFYNVRSYKNTDIPIIRGLSPSDKDFIRSGVNVYNTNYTDILNYLLN